MAVQYEIKITGRVQGVGFRYFVQKRADESNITGWVKNMPDGSVFVMAQGEETDIDTFTDHLKIGPAMSRVIHVYKNKVPCDEKFNSFQVKY